MLLERFHALENLAVDAQELIVLLLLEVGFRRRMLERQPILERRPIAGQDAEGRRVRGLGREGEVEEDERVGSKRPPRR